MDVSVIFKEKARHRQSLFHHGGIIPVCVCVCVWWERGEEGGRVLWLLPATGARTIFLGVKILNFAIFRVSRFCQQFYGYANLRRYFFFGYIILHSYVLGCQFILWCFFYIKYSNIFWFMISKCFKNHNKAPCQIQREPFQEKTWVRGLRPGKTLTSLFSFES